MNESENKLSVGATFLGCAVLYVVAAMALAALIGQPWMPRPARIVIAVLILLGLVAYVLMAIMYLIGRLLGTLGPAAERGEPPWGLYRLMIRFYVPYLRWKGHYKQFEHPDREPIEDVIRRAAEEQATELDLASYLLKSLPPGLTELKSLTSLSFYENVLESVEGIGQLTNLKSLALSDNSLEALPPEFANLKKLKELYISKNALEEFPPEILSLTKLTELEIDGNVLRAIPPSISNLKNLTMLSIGSNELTEIPPEVGQLTKLKSLAVDYNHLRSLPGEIGDLSELESLWLYGNELTTLPPEIGKLTKLKMLNIYNNPLTSIPPEVLELPETTEIIVDNKQMEAIPELQGRPNVKIVG